jgi:hypothetical protein
VRAFLAAPAAAATFALARREGVGVEGLADPAVATALAATAVSELDPWSGHAVAARAAALAEAPRLRSFAAEVLTDPRNAWWSAPLNRSAQLLLTDTVADLTALAVPTRPATRWERYAQKPEVRVETSTMLDAAPDRAGRSGLHAELACTATDWNPTFPLHVIRLRVAAAARVYEIHDARDWHALALRYGERGDPTPDRNLLTSAGIDHGRAPTWSAVARDWDGAHLSFAGFLTSLYTPVRTGGVTTTLWSWVSERTLWLRAVFAGATWLPDLTKTPKP